MFVNFYSTLNYLSNGIHYVKLFWYFFLLSTRFRLCKSWKWCEVDFFIWVFFLPLMTPHIEWAKRYLQHSEITSPLNYSKWNIQYSGIMIMIYKYQKDNIHVQGHWGWFVGFVNVYCTWTWRSTQMINSIEVP